MGNVVSVGLPANTGEMVWMVIQESLEAVESLEETVRMESTARMENAAHEA
jgi:hypothetical protein